MAEATTIETPATPSPEKPEGVVASEPEGAEKKAPEVSYDLKLPEGSTYDAQLLERTVAIARERGLSPEQAQGLVAFTIQEATSHADARLKAMQPGGAEWQKATDGWAEETLNDETLGKSRADREAAVQKGQQFLRQLFQADPEGAKAVTELLETTKLGNHKLFARAFYTLAKASGEGRFVMPGTQSPTTKRAADLLYGASDKTE